MDRMVEELQAQKFYILDSVGALLVDARFYPSESPSAFAKRLRHGH